MKSADSTSIPSAPFFVPALSGDTSGVDYLGLRQVNLALITACFPGLNNVTRLVRPFSVLAWIHWKFHQQAKAEQWTKASERQLQRFQEKVEVLFTWGHKLDSRRAVSIPGSSASVPPADSKGYVDLTFKAWNRTARNTSLQAPVQYGPATKVGSGLGFLESQGSGLNRCLPAGVALAQALDRRLVEEEEAYGLVSSLDRVKGRATDAEALLKKWNAARPSAEEAKVFRAAFYQAEKVGAPGVLGQRSTMIAAVLEVLRSAGRGLDEEEIRRSLVWQRLPKGGAIKFSAPCSVAVARWKILQLRQVQRVALEALLQWFEDCLGTEQDLSEIRKRLAAGFSGDKRSEGGKISCRAASDRFARSFTSEADYRAKCAHGHDDDLLARGLALYESDEVGEKPVEAAWLLIGLARWTQWIAEDADQHHDLRCGGVDRISLWHLHESVERAAERPLMEWMQDVLDRWIIGQHLRVATLRSDGRAQRLRFGLGNEGLEFYANRPSIPVLTQDHLAAVLSLMDNCGLIAGDSSSDPTSYTLS